MREEIKHKMMSPKVFQKEDLIQKKETTIALIVPYIAGGGAERVAADLSAFFSSKGYRVIFFVRGRIRGRMGYPHAGEEIVIPMSSLSQGKMGLRTFSALYKECCILRRLKREYGVDISISFMQESNMINILSRYHDKIIATLHSVISIRTQTQNNICSNKWVYRYLYQLADHIVFVSKYCQHDWIDHYGDILHKTRLIYNPVREMQCTDKEIIGYGNNLILFCARFEGVKRPWHIIRMFSSVLDRVPDAQLLMLGEGMLLAPMKALASAMGMSDKIFFAGRVGNVDDYLKITRISVVASASEAFPCAVIEAMKCGIPIVANDCPGGIREALGIKENQEEYAIKLAKCGLITPLLNGKKYTAADELSIEEMYMADAVVRLLTEKGLYDKCSRHCKQRAKNFNLERIGSIWEELIQ